MDSSKVVPVDHDGIHTQSKSQDKNNSGHEQTLNKTDVCYSELLSDYKIQVSPHLSNADL